MCVYINLHADQILVVFEYKCENVRKQNNMWISTLENSTLLHMNSKGTDRPVHLHSLVSAFVIRILESIKYKLVKSEISIF